MTSHDAPTRNESALGFRMLLYLSGFASLASPCSMSLGWLTESSLMPKRPKQIEEVGKASMVDLRAATYQSEETLHQADDGQRAEEQQRRAKRKASQDALAASLKNRGVSERDAADLAHERDTAERVEASLRRKAAEYEALMRRGESDGSNDNCLVDFEWKQLAGSGADPQFAPPSQRAAQPASMEARPPPPREAADDLLPANAAERARMTQRGAASEAEKRHLVQVAEETDGKRLSVAQSKAKRLRAQEERRAMLRLRQEARLRASSTAQEDADAPREEEQCTQPAEEARSRDGAAAELAQHPQLPPPPPPTGGYNPQYLWPPPQQALPPIPPYFPPAYYAMPPPSLPFPPPPPPRHSSAPSDGPFYPFTAGQQQDHASEEAMRALGLPTSFHDAHAERLQKEEAFEAEEAEYARAQAEHAARVQACWDRFGPYGQPQY